MLRFVKRSNCYGIYSMEIIKSHRRLITSEAGRRVSRKRSGFNKLNTWFIKQ